MQVRKNKLETYFDNNQRWGAMVCVSQTSFNKAECPTPRRGTAAGELRPGARNRRWKAESPNAGVPKPSTEEASLEVTRRRLWS